MTHFVACVMVLLLSVLPGLATTYDVAADFSPTNNPTGAWAYGWSSQLTSALSLYTISYNDRDIDIWWSGTGPNASHNGTSREITISPEAITWQPGQFSLHPGPAGEYSHAQWTAPAEGTCDVAAEFTGLDQTGTTTDVHVLHNGVSLFDASVDGFGDTASFSTTMSVAAGDTVDFAVGYGTAGWWDDTTAVAAVISFESPVEHSTWARVKALYR